MHQNVVSKKVCSKILFSNNDITFDYIDSDIVRFLGDEMAILSIGLNNINLDDVNFGEDDPEIIVHVRLMAWRKTCEQRKAFKEELSKELMLVAWHPKRLWDWCVPKDENKKLKPFFIDKKQPEVVGVGIVSSKINTLTNYRLLNGAVA